MEPRLAIVVGMTSEARVAAAPLVLVGGGSAARVQELLEQAGPLDAVLSFGIAGGLAPGVKPGDLIVAAGVVASGEHFICDARWTASLGQKLPGARRGVLAGADEAIVSPEAKRALHQKTGALAVDMESHGAARFARAKGLPFAVLRAVADPQKRAIPVSALAGFKPDGSADVLAVLAALARRPQDLPGLIHTGLDAQKAMKSLLRCRRLLGAGFGCDDLA
jgi:adenosylhomocysteine nucleosidase